MTWNAGLLRAQVRFDETLNPAPVDHALAAGLGLTSLRWNFLQSKTPNGDFSQYGPCLAKMQQAGLKHYLTLFGPHYDGDPIAFADWAEKAMLWHVTNFPGLLEAAEVWNEPNGTNWPINSTDYMTLIREIDLRRRRHAALVNVRLCGPTAGGGYLDRCIAAGLLTLVQAVSFHIYSGTSEAMYQGLVDTNAKLEKAGRADLRIVISEWGAIKSTAPLGSTERSLAVLKAANCGGSYFPLEDYALFPDKGLLTNAGLVKSPVGQDFKRFFANVPETLKFNSRDTLTSTAYSFLFKSGTTFQRVLWSSKAGGETIHVNGTATQLTYQPIYIPGNVAISV